MQERYRTLFKFIPTIKKVKLNFKIYFMFVHASVPRDY